LAGLEGAQRPDPRRLSELSQACWVLVDIERPQGAAALLELLVAATHHSLETYLAGNPQQAILAARKSCAAAAHKARESLVGEEVARQDRDIREIADVARAGPPCAVRDPLRKRARRKAEAWSDRCWQMTTEARASRVQPERAGPSGVVVDANCLRRELCLAVRVDGEVACQMVPRSLPERVQNGQP